MAASARLRAGSLVAVCSLALFLGALLLFWVQPLLGKLILPSLGGSPAVWTTCMAFVQTALLAGYAWAFALDRGLTPGRQLTVHLAVLAVGAEAKDETYRRSWFAALPCREFGAKRCSRRQFFFTQVRMRYVHPRA